MREYLSKRAAQVPVSGIGEFFAIANSRPQVISLAVGEPDFDTPWHIIDEATYAMKHSRTHYVDMKGLRTLREAICEYQQRRFGLSFRPEEVLVTVGASEAIDLIMRTIIDPGDEVIVLSPCYVAYAPAIILAGGKVVTIELQSENDFKLTYDQLNQAITPKTKAIILNYPSNPTGAIMTKSDYEPLISLIKDRHLMVISDEIYAELTYDHPHCSIASFTAIKEQVILVSGYSKAYAMTGWRVGYIIADEQLIKPMAQIHEYTIMCPTSFSQYGALEATRNGDHDIMEMKSEFERRRNYVVNRIKEMGLTCRMPQGAFYVFFDIRPTGLNSYDFALKLVKEYDVAVVPGSAFGNSGEGFVRISYASAISELKAALDRIEMMIKSLIVD